MLFLKHVHLKSMILRESNDRVESIKSVDPLLDEPPSKRRRSLRPNAEPEQSTNGHCLDDSMDSEREPIVYGAELVIYDKYKRCLLTEGDYEVALQELSKMTYKQQASWETVMEGKVSVKP